ncbi:Tetratricopeptide repeat family protein [Leishmania donovani]|uniref:Tetratricopeptide repeat family protein n=1 Tax=Leishmania donovani TaxID=5661 RepID=A0A504X4L7_LEIDO|nr:Tetratricopeptide repeat family protein [Leishmania donovani]
MSATPPPPSSNASTAYPHARASPGTYRGTGSGAYSRGSSYQPSESSPSSSPIYTSSHSRRGGGSTRVRAHTYGSVYADPAASRAAAPPASLNASVQESLSGYLYTDAIELAQRLFDLEASYAHLHLLAHCYTVSGAAGTAYRLLQHYYPFLELHVTRPWTAGASTSAAGGAAGGVGSGFLPFDARRTWTASYGVHPPQHPFSSGMSSTAAAATFSASSNENNVTSDEFELGYETVDLQSQWDCQYLLGVCCYRTQHYEDGAKVLSQLLEEDDAGVAAAVRTTERQLRTCAFVTEARTSQVLYWLGLCEKHRQRHPIAAEHLRRAYVAHPLRLDAFHEYVHLAWPSEQVVQSLLAVKESLIEEEDRAEVDVTEPPQQRQRPPQRRGRDATDIAVDVDADADDEEQRAPRSAAAVAALASGGGGNHSAASVSPHATQLVRAGPSAVTLPAPCLTAQQRRCAQQHLRPFLHAAFLGITYRCPEANQGGGSAATGAVASTASPWLLRQLALAHFHNGDIQESADAFEQLLRTAPWELMSPALIFYSTALWHLKSESALGSLAQRLTDAEPLSATTLCVVANAYSLIKDPRDALVMLKRAVQVAPTLAYAHALHGYELLGQDSKAEAEAAFKAALAVDASLYIAYAGLGERFMREEQIDKARGYYKEAVKLNPTPAIINRFALTYHRQGKSLADLKTALRLYTESLERHPNNVTARRQRADVLLRLDQPLQALEELKALLVECPGEAVVYVTLAECMVCLRRPHEALQHYQTAMHLDPRRESYVQGCIDQLVAANML